jgi:hypothetical protein
MMLRGLCLGLCLVATTAQAAEFDEAPGAQLRVLDKLTAKVEDVTIARGTSQAFGRMTVQVDACRYPAGNQVAEALAHLTVLNQDQDKPSFSGWMVASSPALSALDDPRYDVWVIRCDVPDLALPEVQPAPEEPAADSTELTDG